MNGHKLNIVQVNMLLSFYIKIPKFKFAIQAFGGGGGVIMSGTQVIVLVIGVLNINIYNSNDRNNCLWSGKEWRMTIFFHSIASLRYYTTHTFIWYHSYHIIQTKGQLIVQLPFRSKIMSTPSLPVMHKCLMDMSLWRNVI